MFAKVYSQIFASSIAENYNTRHVFMDMLVLADSEGVVDMTLSAISRTTNVPMEIVESAIKELSEPDKSSRSPTEDGRRIALVDSHREWGWRIINYDHYRSLRDEEARRSFNRNYMRDYREKNKPVRDVKKCKSPSTSVDSGKALSTHAEGEVEVEEEANKKKKPSAKPKAATDAEFFAELKTNPAYEGIDIEREFAKMTVWCTANHQNPSLRRFVSWLNRVDRPLKPQQTTKAPKSSYDVYR
jgi:hypothetical protein